jgi:hypothetical protein
MNNLKPSDIKRIVDRVIKRIFSDKTQSLDDLLNTSINNIFIEKVNIENATYLLDLSDYELSKIYTKNKDNGESLPLPNFTDFRRYLYDILQNDGKLPINYSYADNNTKLGRLYSNKCSLQRFNNNIKSYLVNGIYDDFDIVNCHPSILLYISNSCKWENKHLTQYVRERDKFLKDNKLTKKDIIIKGLYTDIIDTNINGIERELYQEIHSIREKLYNNNELRHFKPKPKPKPKPRTRGRPKKQDIEIEEDTFSTDNPKGSFLSSFLGYFELLLVNLTINKLDITDSVGVNMYDGLLIKKNVVTIEQLNNVTNPYGIKWSKKPLRYQIEEGLEEYNYNDSKVYNQVKKEFESKNFFIKKPYLIVSKTDEGFVLHKPKEFKESHQNLHCVKLVTINQSEKKLEKKCFVDYWFKDINRKQYDTINFIPYSTKETPEYLIKNKIQKKTEFNTFEGFDRIYISKDKRNEKYNEDIKFVLDEYLNKVVCDNDIEKYKYLISYISHFLQKPREKEQVATCLFGIKGGGKGTYVEFIKYLLEEKNKGSHNIKYTYICDGNPDESVFNRFNRCISNKLLINLNEFGKRDFINNCDKIKPLITDYIASIEDKGINGRTIENSYHRVIITSDKEQPITITKDERRFFLLKISSLWKGNRDNFTKINNLFSDNDFMNHLHSYFMDIDITFFKPTDYPETQEYKNFREDNIKPVYKFLKEYFVDDKERFKDNIQFNKKLNKDGVYFEHSKNNSLILEEFKSYLLDNGYLKEYKTWNRQQYINQFREVEIGIYGFKKQIQKKINGKNLCHIFVVIPELERQLNKYFDQVDKEDIDDDIDTNKIVKSGCKIDPLDRGVDFC